MVFLDIFIDSFNETIVDDQFNATDYIKTIISETNGPDSSGAWLKYALEEVFSTRQLKNGSLYRLTPGLIDVSNEEITYFKYLFNDGRCFLVMQYHCLQESRALGCPR